MSGEKLRSEMSRVNWSEALPDRQEYHSHALKISHSQYPTKLCYQVSSHENFLRNFKVWIVWRTTLQGRRSERAFIRP